MIKVSLFSSIYVISRYSHICVENIYRKLLLYDYEILWNGMLFLNLYRDINLLINVPSFCNNTLK